VTGCVCVFDLSTCAKVEASEDADDEEEDNQAGYAGECWPPCICHAACYVSEHTCAYACVCEEGEQFKMTGDEWVCW
jgi:hypothetical protein